MTSKTLRSFFDTNVWLSFLIGKYFFRLMLAVSEIFRELYEVYRNLDSTVDNSMYISNARKQFIKFKIKNILNAPNPIPPAGEMQILRLSDYTIE